MSQKPENIVSTLENTLQRPVPVGCSWSTVSPDVIWLYTNENMNSGVGTGNKWANQKEGFVVQSGLETGSGDLEIDAGSYGFGNYHLYLHLLLHWLHIHS